MDAASLVVRISAEGADSAINAIKNVGSAVDEAGRKIMGIGDTLMGFGAKMTAGVTAPLTAMGLIAVKDFAKFESAVTVLELHAGSAGDAFGGMSDVVLRLGSDVNLFGVEATNAALALTDFYKQGLTTNEIFGDLQGYMAGTAEVGGAFRASVDMAAASGLDLNRSSQIVLQTMKQFQLPFSEAAEVVDTLVRAANAGSAEVAGLADGLAVVGPYAKQAGFSVEDTAIALGILADRGIRGSEAGTMLRSILTQITSTAKPTVEALDELGVSLFTLEGTGPMKELPVIFQELSDAMADLDPKEQMRILNQLADTRAISGLALQMSEGAEGWSTYAEKMQDAVGAGEEAAARIDTLTGSLAKFGDAISTLKVAAMEGPVEDTLRPLIDGVTELVSSLSQLDPDTLNFGVKIAAGLAAIGPGLLALGALTKLVGLAAVGIGALASPLGLAIGGAIALAAAWDPLTKALNTKFDTNLPSVADGLQHIADTAERAAEAVFIAKSALQLDWGKAIEEANGVELDWDQIKSNWSQGFQDIWSALTSSDVRKQMKDDAYEIGQSYTDAAIQGLTSASSMAAAERGHAQLVAQNMASSITTELGAIDWSPAATGIMAGMESVTVDPALGAALADNISQAAVAGMESVTIDPAIGQGIMDQVTASLDAAGLDGSALLNQLLSGEALAGAELDLSGLATAVNTALQEALPAGMEGLDLSGVGTAVAESIGGSLGTALASADFSSVATSLATAFQAIDVSSAGAAIVSSLTAGVSAAASGVSAAGAALAAGLASGVTAAAGTLSAAGAAAAASFAAGVQAGVGAAAAAGAALAAAVTSAVGSIDLYSAGASAGSSLAAGLMSQVGAVSAAAAALSAAAKTSTKKELQMRSPSRVFMEYGELAAQGFALGLAGAGVGQASPRVTLNINGASFGQQPGGAGLMRAIDDYLRLNGTLSRV